MTLYAAGKIQLVGTTYFCGEIGRAAKNLYIWRKYKVPMTAEQLGREAPIIAEKGRCKTLNQAEEKLEQISQEVVKELKKLQQIILHSEIEQEDSITLESTDVK